MVFTLAFWKAATERALKTAAQFVLASIGVGVAAGTQSGDAADVINAFALDYVTLGGAALGGVLVSYLTSVVSAPFAGSGPSLANETVGKHMA